MGCGQSKPSPAAAAPQDARSSEGDRTLLAGAGEQKEQAGTPAAAAQYSRQPQHVDTTVMMCPYFKVSPGSLQLWKRECDSFYAAAKKEDGMLFYGFAYSEAEGSGEVLIREGFKDASSLIAHIRAVDVPLQAALKLSQLERVEVYGPGLELQKLRADSKTFGGTCFQFFEKEPQSLMRPTPNSGDSGSDKLVSIAQYYKVTDENVAAVKEQGDTLAGHAAAAPGLEHYSLSLSDGLAHVYHSFADAKGALDHMMNTHGHRKQTLEQCATLDNLEIHAPSSELEKIRAFIAQAAPQGSSDARSAGAAVASGVGSAEGAVEGVAHVAGDAADKAREAQDVAEAMAQSLSKVVMYVLDGKAIRRTFSGTLAKVQQVDKAVAHVGRTALEHAEGAGAAETHAAGAAASGAVRRVEGAAVKAEQHAEEGARAAVGAAKRLESEAECEAGSVGAAMAATGEAVVVCVAATGSAAGSTMHRDVHRAQADIHAAEASVDGALHRTEDATAGAEIAAEGEVHAAGSAISGTAHRLEKAVSNAAHAATAAMASAAHRAEAAAAAAVASGAAAGAAAEASYPHRIDTTITMCPYFKVKASDLELWKAQCDAFYAAAKEEDGMLFYGFCYEEREGEGEVEVHIREGFKSAAALLAHLRAIDVPLRKALQVSKLDRVELHGPPRELEAIRKEATQLGGTYFRFFNQEPEALRRITPHTGKHGSDATVSVTHCFESATGDAALLAHLKKVVSSMNNQAREAPGMEHHAFSFSASRVDLRQGFASAEAAIASLISSSEQHAEILKGSALQRFEVHGPASELLKMKAFAMKEGGSNKVREASMYVLDGRAIRRGYSAAAAAATSAACRMEAVVVSSKATLLAGDTEVSVEGRPAPKLKGSCGFLGACGC